MIWFIFYLKRQAVAQRTDTLHWRVLPLHRDYCFIQQKDPVIGNCTWQWRLMRQHKKCSLKWEKIKVLIWWSQDIYSIIGPWDANSQKHLVNTLRSCCGNIIVCWIFRLREIWSGNIIRSVLLSEDKAVLLIKWESALSVICEVNTLLQTTFHISPTQRSSDNLRTVFFYISGMQVCLFCLPSLLWVKNHCSCSGSYS